MGPENAARDQNTSDHCSRGQHPKRRRPTAANNTPPSHNDCCLSRSRLHRRRTSQAMTSYLRLYTAEHDKRREAEAKLARADRLIETFRQFMRFKGMESDFVGWLLTEHDREPTQAI